MSSYMYFTFKRGDIYCPLVAYCRSHPLYQELNENYNIPFEGFAEWHRGDLNEAIDCLHDSLVRYQECIDRNLKHIEIVKTMTGSVEERMEYVAEDLRSNESLMEEIDTLRSCIGKLRFMVEMIDDVYDKDAAIYVGIESGYKTATGSDCDEEN